MKNRLIQFFRFLLSLLPSQWLVILLEQIFIVIKIQPLKYAYQRIGINEKNPDISEKLFLLNNLSSIFGVGKNAKLTLFDVGANRGKYTEWLRNSFSNATIHSFEPLPNAFSEITEKFISDENVILNNIGLSDTSRTETIYTYTHDSQSEHATFHQDVLEIAHGSSDNIAINITVVTIDAYCHENDIEKIDFLKIDAEGHELSILKGAAQMLKDNRINTIQLEFNEMNVFSRVYLKDFYDLLQGYDFYRLSNKGLIPLYGYKTENEIFKFQNIVATCVLK